MLPRRITLSLVGIGAVIAAVVPTAAASADTTQAIGGYPPPCPVTQPVQVTSTSVIIRIECSETIVVPLPSITTG